MINMGPTKRVKTPENHHLQTCRLGGWVGIFWDRKPRRVAIAMSRVNPRNLTENLGQLKGFLPPKKLDQNVCFSRLIWVQKICNKEIISNKNCTRCFFEHLESSRSYSTRIPSELRITSVWNWQHSVEMIYTYNRIVMSSSLVATNQPTKELKKPTATTMRNGHYLPFN